MKGEDKELRAQLEDILCSPINSAVGIRKKLKILKRQDAEIEKILGKSLPFPLDDPKYLLVLNCYSYALNLWKLKPFLKAAEAYTGEDNIISTDHVLNFINKFKPKKLTTSQDKCLVLYFNDKTLKHAGVVISENLVESKWDKCAVYRHSVWHVPASYGNTVNYYVLPSQDEIDTYFLNTLNI